MCGVSRSITSCSRSVLQSRKHTSCYLLRRCYAAYVLLRQVFLGRKKGTGALYAIKVMNKSFIKDMDMERRVLQERRVSSSFITCASGQQH